MKFEVKEPIVVFGPMNSGTSLTMGLLHIGGAWIGETKSASKRNRLGFFENIGINESIYKSRKSGLVHKEIRNAIESEILSQGYCGGQWAVKLFYKQIHFIRSFNPFWIFTTRNPENILKSHLRHTNVGPEKSVSESKEWSKVCAELSNVDEIKKSIMKSTNKYRCISPDLLVEGQHDQLLEIYSACNLIYYPDLVNHFIVPDYWEYRDQT